MPAPPRGVCAARAFVTRITARAGKAAARWSAASRGSRPGLPAIPLRLRGCRTWRACKARCWWAGRHAAAPSGPAAAAGAAAGGDQPGDRWLHDELDQHDRHRDLAGAFLRLGEEQPKRHLRAGRGGVRQLGEQLLQRAGQRLPAHRPERTEDRRDDQRILRQHLEHGVVQAAAGAAADVAHQDQGEYRDDDVDDRVHRSAPACRRAAAQKKFARTRANDADAQAP